MQDKFENPLLRDAYLIGLHESGHNIVARILGFTVGYISVEIGIGGNMGNSEVELASKLDSLELVERYSENRIIMLYSGALAETLVERKTDPNKAWEILKYGSANSDFEKAKELLHLLRSIKNPDSSSLNEVQTDLSRIERECWHKAIQLVESNSSIIRSLASNLTSKVESIGEEYRLEKVEIDALPDVVNRFDN